MGSSCLTSPRSPTRLLATLPTSGREKRVRGASSSFPIQLSNSQASAARVLVRRRVRLSFSSPKKSEGAERRQARQQFHACEARRVSCAADKFTQSAQTSTRHARLSALHRGGFCRRDCSVRHPDRPFGLIPQASACVRPGASATRRALVVGPGSNPEAPGDGLRNHPQAPHPLRQSRRLMMAPPDEQAATGYRIRRGKRRAYARYARKSASAWFYSEKPVDSALITARVVQEPLDLAFGSTREQKTCSDFSESCSAKGRTAPLAPDKASCSMPRRGVV